MTRKEIIKKALRNNEIELDTAGLILLENCSNAIINKALEREYIGQELANQLLNVKEESEVEP